MLYISYPSSQAQHKALHVAFQWYNVKTVQIQKHVSHFPRT